MKMEGADVVELLRRFMEQGSGSRLFVVSKPAGGRRFPGNLTDSMPVSKQQLAQFTWCRALAELANKLICQQTVMTARSQFSKPRQKECVRAEDSFTSAWLITGQQNTLNYRVG